MAVMILFYKKLFWQTKFQNPSELSILTVIVNTPDQKCYNITIKSLFQLNWLSGQHLQSFPVEKCSSGEGEKSGASTSNDFPVPI